MKKILTILLAVLFIAIPLSACSKSSNTTIVMYDGKYSERKLLTRMAKYVVEAHTDLTVDIRDEMTDVNMYNELLGGGIDLMVCYDGTLLTTYLKMEPGDVPEGETLYDFVNREASKQKQVHLLDKLGINNTYALGVPKEIADKYNLVTLSDLVLVAPELIFGAEHEFFSEEGSMKFSPFTKFYGLNFKEARPMDGGLKYAAIENGELDVMVVYTTDGLNKKAQLVVLEDDRQYFPDYNGAYLVKDDFFEKYKNTPNLEEVLNSLGGTLTNEIMTDLTYQCDVEGRPFDDVAKEFLQSKGLI